MIPVYLDHLPAGVSTRTLVHYAQLHLNNDQFAWYDYGSPEENLEHYGSEIPPIYNLSQVENLTNSEAYDSFQKLDCFTYTN